MKQIVKTIILAGGSSFLAITLIQFPDEAFKASIRGLNMWWEIVFPSLLPFFITAELLLGFGVVRFIGVLFEPIMRPLFNVPGVGSFAWAMGMASGYPTGAKIAVRLREENQVTKTEAERLVSFTNASSPLFIFGAISVGFFHDVRLGVLLAVSHYIGNALVGICMRFYKRSKDNHRTRKKRGNASIVRAFQEMHETRLSDPRPFGQILGDAVLNSIKTLVMVGGFIILFSVLTKMSFLIGVSSIIANQLQHVLSILSIPVEYALPLFSGFFEITLGSQMISQVSVDSLLASIMLVSFILGFNGFSVQAQVASIISKTDISFMPYFYGRILHGTFASILTVVFYKPLYLNRQAFDLNDMPVNNPVADHSWAYILDVLAKLGPIITIACLSAATIILFKRTLKN